MAITTTILRKICAGPGNRFFIYGKSIIGGVTNTEEVVTGLDRVDSFEGTVSGALASTVATNETFPLLSGTVTVYTTNNDETFYWEAIGRR